MKTARLCLSLLCFLSLQAFAAKSSPPMQSALVDAVVMPAWLERSGRSDALIVGAEVKAGDRIRTGTGARVYLHLADGSTVKIGANAKFAVGEQDLIDRELFKAAYDVLEGAFRFTTDKLRKIQPIRDVSIKVATATIGIRGTDVWGKTEPTQDQVVLIEGEVIVTHASGAATPMAGARAMFVAPRGAAPLPLSRISEEDLAQRSRETEIAAGDGAVRSPEKGKKVKAKDRSKTKLRLGTELDREHALEVRDMANHHGYAVTIKPRRDGIGGWNYDVLIGGFASPAEATAIKDKMPEKLRKLATVI